MFESDQNQIFHHLESRPFGEELVQKVLKVVDGLRDFSDFHQDNMLDQLTHWMNEIKIHIDKCENVQLDHYPQLRDYFVGEILSFVKKSLIKLPGVRDLTYDERLEGIQLRSLQLMISQLPAVYQYLDYLQLRKTIAVQVDGPFISLIGEMASENCGEADIREVKALTRQFCEHNILVSKKPKLVSDNLEKKHIVTFDFSFDPTKRYCSRFKGDQNTLFLPNTFSHYHMTLDDSDFQSGPVLEINEDFETLQFNSCPPLSPFLDTIENPIGQEGELKTLFHFPFFFAPFSVIIPKRGQVISLKSFDLKNQDRKTVSREGLSSVESFDNHTQSSEETANCQSIDMVDFFSQLHKTQN